jgi:hypothetical protein
LTSSSENVNDDEKEESASDTRLSEPVISFFSRQPPQKSFPSLPPTSDPYDEDLVSRILNDE